ncbi:hypothetical protein [Peribacillus frigoritolerans]|uniref:hypothetical protein n=1 Tax=Peribacillus frigoritolerans TaxID=450367 RepID=UPI003B8E7392
MKYSKDPNQLPPVANLKLHKKYNLYNEVLRRFPSYYNFGTRYKKESSRVNEGHWTKQNIFKVFLELLNNDLAINQRNLNSKGYSSVAIYVRELGGLIQAKLDFYEQYYQNVKVIGKEIIFLENVGNNKGTNIMNKVTPEQQMQAMDIIANIKKISKQN